MGEISITEISRNFADYVNRVAYRGEHFILLRGKKPVAELRPVPTGRKLGDLKSLLNALPKLSGLETQSFTQDLELLREAGNQEMLKNLWES